MNTENLSVLRIHKLSKSQYENAFSKDLLETNSLYLTPDTDTENIYNILGETVFIPGKDHTTLLVKLDQDLKDEANLRISSIQDLKEEIKSKKLQVNLSSTTPGALYDSKIGVDGVLPIINGGTGTEQMPNQWGIIYANSTTSYASTTKGADGQLLQANGANAPTWVTPSSANVNSSIVKRDGSGNFSANIISANLNGNASSANKVNNILKINNQVFNGSAEIDVGIININCGGTGTNIAPNSGGIVCGSSSRTYTSIEAGQIGDILMSNGLEVPYWHTPASSNLVNTIVQRDANGNFSAGIITATLNGTSSQAEKFNGLRTIKLIGDVTGEASSNGASGWTLTTAVGDNTHNHTWSNISDRDSFSINTSGSIAAASVNAAKIITANYGTNSPTNQTPGYGVNGALYFQIV